MGPFFCRLSPFLVEFHDLRTFVTIYILARFTHFFRKFFFGQNILLCNITHFLHVCLHHLEPSCTILHHLAPSCTILHHVAPEYARLCKSMSEYARVVPKSSQ